jgi:tetratricopeptide (TPR) repeat protein
MGRPGDPCSHALPRRTNPHIQNRIPTIRTAGRTEDRTFKATIVQRQVIMNTKIAFLAIAALAATATAQQNPHDGYVFWLPCGELKIGDAKSEKEFKLTRDGQAVSFVAHPRRTRFDVPKGQMVVVMPQTIPANKGLKTWPTYLSEGKSKQLIPVNYLPHELTAGKNDIPITVSTGLKNGMVLRFYWTDDSDKLGADLSKALFAPDADSPSDRYLAALVLLVDGKPEHARSGFLDLAAGKPGAGRAVTDPQPTTQAQRLCRRMARWCDAEIQFKKIQTGQGFYDLGLYSMVNGFWDLAEKSFRQATVKMPKNPDAWYMLADALSYKESDLDLRMEQIYPYYKKAADLYPRTNSNTFRTFFGFFKNLKIKDGDKTTVLHMTDEQIAYAKKAWTWCSAIMEASSRGSLRMVNTYKVYEQEFDSTRDWNPRPFRGLFRPGTVDTFIKMTGWGASDCCGMDTGPDRSAFINLGIREWDVMLHEWNHSLDWAMISDELGVGVPETHSSDWCGFEPISTMGMGHHSCNRYYMTPGMYRYVRGSDEPPKTSQSNWTDTWHVVDWAVAGPYDLVPDVKDPKGIDEAYNKAVVAKTQAVAPPAIESLKDKPKTEDGYVDFKATWPNAPINSYAFAKTYVYSPKTQKLRMWLGADDNIRIWLNGKLIHRGIYWSTCQFLGLKMKDQISGAVVLQKGWNSVLVQITSIQHGPDWQTDEIRPDQWGFSFMLCDTQNRVVEGVKWQSTRPEGLRAPLTASFNPAKPMTYEWSAVADDYTTLLPALTENDLRAITGYKTLTVTNEMLFDISRETAALGPVIAKADPTNVALNNQLNWFFSPKEFAAVLRYRRGSTKRDLLFIRPEGYESFLRLLPVLPAAKALGVKSHASQVIGYLTVPRPDSPHGRIVLVVDTFLGDKLPVDEEDLMNVDRLR